MPICAETPSLRPASNIYFQPFTSGGLLFRKGSRRIWVLNHSAAVIWCFLDRVNSLEALVRVMRDTYPKDATIAHRDVVDTIDFFNQEGLLGQDVTRPIENEPEGYPDLSQQGPKLNKPSQWLFNGYFSFPGQSLELSCQNATLGETLGQLFNHFALSQADSVFKAETRIWLLPDSGNYGRWLVGLDGRLFQENVATDEAVALVFLLIFLKSCKALDDKLLLHAAVSGRENGVIVFPGLGGAGKTTLTAFMARRGWRFFTDELAILDAASHLVEPFPLPMLIKSGSMDVLREWYPELATAPSSIRPDGTTVHYLLPPSQFIAKPDEAAPVAAIVFPRYNSKDSGNTLLVLSKEEALQRLVGTCSSDRELRVEDIRTLAHLVERKDCFELTYSDLPEAAELLEKIL